VLKLSVKPTVKKLDTELVSCFRFLNLNKLQAYTLEREVLGATKRLDCEKECYVGCVTLLEDNLAEIFNFFIRQRITVEQCDLLISLFSNMQTTTTEVPRLVNQMLRFIDCKLTMSYTILAND
jgi:hypothetical protein